jgi:hypothetical protein
LRNIKKLFWESCVIVDHEYVEKQERQRERERERERERRGKIERQRDRQTDRGLQIGVEFKSYRCNLF